LPLTITLPGPESLTAGLLEADGVAMVDAADRVVGFARIYRIRRSPAATTLYFDRVVPVPPTVIATSLGLPVPTGIIERVAWPTFAAAVKTATGREFEKIDPIKGETRAEQDHLRRLFQLAVMDDLLGPANGPNEEVVGMSVRDRYLVGKLAPKDTAIAEEDDEDLGTEGEDEESKDAAPSRSQSLVPSSSFVSMAR
jgi:hypothetical protein